MTKRRPPTLVPMPGPGPRPQAPSTRALARKPRKPLVTWKTPAGATVAHIGVTLLALGLGVAYDLAERSPGVLTILAFLALGGPSSALAVKLWRAAKVAAKALEEDDEDNDNDDHRKEARR